MIGMVSLMSLLLKWYYESPWRKLIVFLLDIFKQIASGTMIHMYNVSISIVLTEN